jgi:hypothetical protein
LLHSGQWGGHWHNFVAMAIKLSNNFSRLIVLLLSGSLSASLFTQHKLRGDATQLPGIRSFWCPHSPENLANSLIFLGQRKTIQTARNFNQKINCCTKIGK